MSSPGALFLWEAWEDVPVIPPPALARAGRGCLLGRKNMEKPAKLTREAAPLCLPRPCGRTGRGRPRNPAYVCVCLPRPPMGNGRGAEAASMAGTKRARDQKSRPCKHPKQSRVCPPQPVSRRRGARLCPRAGIDSCRRSRARRSPVPKPGKHDTLTTNSTRVPRPCGLCALTALIRAQHPISVSYVCVPACQ